MFQVERRPSLGSSCRRNFDCNAVIFVPIFVPFIDFFFYFLISKIIRIFLVISNWSFSFDRSSKCLDRAFETIPIDGYEKSSFSSPTSRSSPDSWASNEMGKPYPSVFYFSMLTFLRAKRREIRVPREISHHYSTN